jgi:hypothetical protein
MDSLTHRRSKLQSRLEADLLRHSPGGTLLSFSILLYAIKVNIEIATLTAESAQNDLSLIQRCSRRQLHSANLFLGHAKVSHTASKSVSSFAGRFQSILYSSKESIILELWSPSECPSRIHIIVETRKLTCDECDVLICIRTSKSLLSLHSMGPINISRHLLRPGSSFLTLRCGMLAHLP